MNEQWLSESEHQKWLHITAVMAWVVGMLMGTMIGISIMKERRIENVKLDPPVRLECPKS